MKALLITLIVFLSINFALIKNTVNNDISHDTIDTDKNAISDGISEYVENYGIIANYDSNKRILSYTYVEIVDENDKQRISELKQLGVEMDFPNGYFIFMSNDFLLDCEVSESVSVELLNEESVLEKSSIDEFADRLEGHPEFFLCKLKMYEGKVIAIEEIFTP